MLQEYTEGRMPTGKLGEGVSICFQSPIDVPEGTEYVNSAIEGT
jgi:hypothetical protein